MTSGEIKKDIDSNKISSIIFAMFIGDIVSWTISDDLNLFDIFSNHLDYIWEDMIV